MPNAAAELGVLGLDVALRRVKRLGATVENVKAAGEIRVVSPDLLTRLTINARRKDATRELMQLIATLEARKAAQPAPAAHPTPIPLRARSGPAGEPVRANLTAAERIRRHIRETCPPDGDGWREYRKAEITEELGVDAQRLSVWASQATSAAHLEHRIQTRTETGGRRITHLRFISDLSPEERPALPAQATRAGRPLSPREEPAYPPTRELTDANPEPIAGVLPTPHLAAYAAATKLSHAHPLLRVHLSDEEQQEINREAIRLYWWARAGGSQ